MKCVKVFSSEVKKGLYLNKNLGLILAAGFEDRDIAVLNYAQELTLQIKKIIIIDYENKVLNEDMRSEIINKANKLASSSIIEEDNLIQMQRNLEELEVDRLIIDITGMTRVLIFRILKLLENVKYIYDIVYTEAQTYYPLKSFYDEIASGGLSDEVSFFKYLDKEKTPQIIYSYDCDIIQPKELIGNPEPGKPAMLIAFFAFKRSRLQVILQHYEVEKKIFILSEPVREDLKWRQNFMEIANYDLIQKNRLDIETLNTLNPFQVMEYLDRVTYKTKNYTRYNIILAPLGSKMQTVGCYLYWRKHPDVSLVFSQPRHYFKEAYSKSYKNTFLLLSEHILNPESEECL